MDLRSKIKTCNLVAFRKLRVSRSPQLLKALLQFRNEMKDVPYETDALQLISSAFEVNHVQDLSSVFCSELIAEAYKRMGLLPETCVSSKFTPQSFVTDDLVDSLLINCKLEREVDVSLEEAKPPKGIIEKLLKKRLSDKPIAKGTENHRC